jgi:hypothetical protein
MSEPRRPSTESELIEFIRSSDVRAPEALHEQVQALADERTRRRWRRRAPAGQAAIDGAGKSGVAAGSKAATRRAGPLAPLFSWRLGAVVAAAAIAGALVAGLTGGGSSGLNVRQASALALSQATEAAPAQSKTDPDALAVSVNGVAFPYWEDRFGWRAVGTRTDRVAGRQVTTVFYGNHRGQTIGYAIASGANPPRISGGRVAWRRGVHYWLLNVNGAPAVTWLRDGHLCVVAGRGVDSATLLRLASWTDHGLAA